MLGLNTLNDTKIMQVLECLTWCLNTLGYPSKLIINDYLGRRSDIVVDLCYD